ncbi:MAG TPA: NAD(P)H-dependent oxidoreductase subunit E [Candidatus Bathyarchaeia archaeon]|nr:NAD(P)H-dependent oxidoreductase subunit E [Candidatus Bathyarchaeia archaeon]
METQVNGEEILEIVRKHEGNLGGLIALLTEIQEVYGYLPEKTLRIVATATGTSLVDVYGAATFYRAFSLRPRGKHHVCTCQGTACHVRGAQAVATEFERQLGIPAGETTPDGNFTLETVNCLGACALGPIVVTDGDCHTKVRPAAVKGILKKSRLTPGRARRATGSSPAAAGKDVSSM